MSNINQNLVNAQAEINRSVQASNLTNIDFERLKGFGSTITNEKSALEYMRYHAEKAIVDLNKFLEETK